MQRMDTPRSAARESIGRACSKAVGVGLLVMKIRSSDSTVAVSREIVINTSSRSVRCVMASRAPLPAAYIGSRRASRARFSASESKARLNASSCAWRALPRTSAGLSGRQSFGVTWEGWTRSSAASSASDRATSSVVAWGCATMALKSRSPRLSTAAPRTVSTNVC